MTEQRLLDYVLVVDGERVRLDAGMTLGRHLENDLVIAGDDVLDFHVRIDVAPRGPVVVPLGEAVVSLNGILLDLPTGLMPADRLEVGQSLVVLEFEAQDHVEAVSWHLCAPGDPEGLEVLDIVRVGREPDSDLLLTDLHASRRHARVCNVAGSIWVQDLGSANGTFLNGERIRGARRVYHGDELRFDRHACQLLGRGADLTPARAAANRDSAPYIERAALEFRPNGRDTLEFTAVPASAPAWSEAPRAVGPGAYLVSAGAGPAGWHRLPMGRTLIGRRPECDLELRDRTVSAQHAEVVLRPEGATITDLMSTNGTRCNERPIQSSRLADGDRLTLGRVDLQYREIAPARERSKRRYRALIRLAAAVATAAALSAVVMGLL